VKKHYISVMKTTPSMLYRNIIAVRPTPDTKTHEGPLWKDRSIF